MQTVKSRLVAYGALVLSLTKGPSYIGAALLSAGVGLLFIIGSRIAANLDVFVWDGMVLIQYVLTSITTGLVGPTLLFIHRLNQKDQHGRFGVFTMHWPEGKANVSDVGPIRAKTAYSLRNLVDGISSRDIEAESEILANQIVHWTISQQETNVREYGRIQLITRTPGLNSSERSKGAYQLISEYAKAGDQVYATAFTNTRLWWLRPQSGQKFFDFNLRLIEAGINIRRVFGVNHPSWVDFDLAEDEEGSKRDLIQLHADLSGTETYTLEYETFSNPSLRRHHRAKQKDCLLLIRNGVPRIGLEWIVDVFGEATQVYVVFGQSHLRKLTANFESILALNEQQGLSRVEQKQPLDPRVAVDRLTALRRLDSALH